MSVGQGGEFRFVIVGAGSAGCLLARLLAERQSEPVAVIEAGAARQDVRSTVPNFYPRTFGSALDWNLATVPQAGLAQRRIAWPRGKTVGGSGAINALIYMQAAAADFAHWGWSHEMASPALSSDSLSSDAQSNRVRPPLNSASSNSVPLNIAPLASPHPWTAGFLQAAQASGLQRIDNWTQSTADSCGYYQLAQRQGRRCHTGQLLQPAANQPPISNLKLITAATVQRIVLRGQRAVAVELLDAHGQLQSIAASGEIIICAGTIGSPAILLASGIGPAGDLLAEQLSCQHALPAVGKNLQDHLVFPLIYSTLDSQGLPRRHSTASRQRYRSHADGPLASNIAEAGALFQPDNLPPAHSTGAEGNTPRRPEFQLHFTPTHYLKYPRLDSGDHFFSVGITDLHPRSQGQVRLVRPTSTSESATGPLAQWQTLIDPQYLTESVDRQRMLQAIACTRQLCQHSGLRELIQQEALPGAKRSDDASLLKSLQTFAQSIYHPVGTCRMDSGLAEGCQETVVDRDFRVHGLAGLRVVDASVLPSLPSCNTNAITLWLAQQALEKLCG